MAMPSGIERASERVPQIHLHGLLHHISHPSRPSQSSHPSQGSSVTCSATPAALFSDSADSNAVAAKAVFAKAGFPCKAEAAAQRRPE